MQPGNRHQVTGALNQSLSAWEHRIFQVFFFFFRVYLLLAVLGLRCSGWASSSCGKRGFSSLQREVSRCGDFSCCGAQALGILASVVAARWLSDSEARGIFPDQGLNPGPLQWQADS